MALSSLKLATYSPVPRSLVGRSDWSFKPVASVSTGEHRLQGKSQNIVKARLKKDNGISRREALPLMTGTLVLTSFLSADSASARLSRSEMRRKIMEKLEQLREKAGLKKEEKKEPKLEKKDTKVEKKEEKKETKVEKKEENKEPKVEKTEGVL